MIYVSYNVNPAVRYAVLTACYTARRGAFASAFAFYYSGYWSPAGHKLQYNFSFIPFICT